MLRTLIVALALAGCAGAQNLFAKRANARSLFADHRARGVGDVLTVVVKETARVKQEDKVDRQTTSDLSAKLEAFTLTNKAFKSNVLPEFDVTKQSSFEANAKQEKDNNVEARIAVVVIDVLPNNVLVVAGTRVVRVDDETKTLRISGLVRPLDVTKDNTVLSSQVADARVAITGDGANTRATTKGPVGTLVDTLIWAAWPF
jgi:flagellar L-ring protein precursor FlgH